MKIFSQCHFYVAGPVLTHRYKGRMYIIAAALWLTQLKFEFLFILMGVSLFTKYGAKEREIWRSNFLKSLALKLLIERINFLETHMKRPSNTALAFYYRYYKILLFIAEIISILMLMKSLKQVYQNYRML